MLLRLVLLLLIAWPGASSASSFGLPEPAGPETYTSDSGVLALRIEPLTRAGDGDAKYTLTRDGATAWSVQLPFALNEAVVADDGTSAGYAYDGNDFVVAVIDAGGTLRAEHRTARVDSNYLHVQADPKSNGVFLQPALGRFVVRVDDPDVNFSAERWWKFALADGRRVATSTPKSHMPPSARAVQDARALAGSELTLVHWYRHDAATGATGTTFTLVDPEDRPVWTLELPTDYRDVESPWDVVALLAVGPPGRFALRHVAAGLRVEYTVARDAAAPRGWRVAEAGRSPFVAPPPSPPAADRYADVPVVALQRLGTIVLDVAAAAASPIRDIHDFAIDDRGRFGLLTGCACRRDSLPALVVVDGDGKLVRRVSLPASAGENYDFALAALGGDDWLVTRSLPRSGERTMAWRIDVGDGRVERARGFGAHPAEAVIALGDGGIAMLTTEHGKATMTDRLEVFDADGAPRWTVDKYFAEPGGLLSPEDVTVTTSGLVVVLDNIDDELEVYDRAGAHQQKIELKDAWGRDPNYPTGIEADAAGGVIVHDFDGQPQIVRMRLDGKVVAGFDPVHPDGRKVDIVGNVQRAPDGTLWTSDGDVLLRLDERGTVDRVLGAGLDHATVGEVANLAVDADRTIYAVSRRTGSVHVFDADGRRLRICSPLPTDQSGDWHDPAIVIDAAGHVYVQTEDKHGINGARYVHYDPDCARIGTKDVPGSRGWYPQPGSASAFTVAFDDAKLIGADGTVKRELDRMADGNWLDKPAVGVVGRDGSIVILSDPYGTAMLTLFSRDGDARHSWPAPNGLASGIGRMAYDGTVVAMVVPQRQRNDTSDVVVTDPAGTPMFRVPLPDPAQQTIEVHLVAGANGTELWVWDNALTIERYALPR